MYGIMCALRVIFLAIILFIIPSPSMAFHIGTLQNTNKNNNNYNDFITGECTEQNNTLKCNFIQISVSKSLNEITENSEIINEYKENPNIFDKFTDDGTCNALLNPNKEQMEKTKASILEDPTLEQVQKAYIKVCKEKNLESFLIFSELINERKKNTCKIISNPYIETFKPDNNGGWVSVRGPSGTCGLIVISTLKKDGLEDLFWKYTTQKKIMNRDASHILGKCEDAYDETESTYSWRNKDKYMNCIYIHFGF